MNIVSLKAYKSHKEVLSGYKDLLSVQHLAEIFEVSKQTIYKEIKAGKFRTPIQIGRMYKIPKAYVAKKFFYEQ